MKASKNIVNVFNFELTAYQDHDSSQFWFNDFKSEIAGRSVWCGDRQTDFLAILPESESITDSHYKPSKLKRMNKADLLAECLMFEDCFYCSEDSTRAELIYLLESKDHEDYYKALYSEKSWHDLPNTFGVTGYSQGDAIKVLLTDPKSKEFTQGYLQNIFFDAPKFVQLTITDNEGNELEVVDLYEYIDSYSLYYKVEALRIMVAALDGTEYQKHAKDFLQENLPEYLD